MYLIFIDFPMKFSHIRGWIFIPCYFQWCSQFRWINRVCTTQNNVIKKLFYSDFFFYVTHRLFGRIKIVRSCSLFLVYNLYWKIITFPFIIVVSAFKFNFTFISKCTYLLYIQWLIMSSIVFNMNRSFFISAVKISDKLTENSISYNNDSENSYPQKSIRKNTFPYKIFMKSFHSNFYDMSFVLFHFDFPIFFCGLCKYYITKSSNRRNVNHLCIFHHQTYFISSIFFPDKTHLIQKPTFLSHLLNSCILIKSEGCTSNKHSHYFESTYV